MPAPTFQRIFWADYDADTGILQTAAEHGVYLLLIKAYWQRQKPLPDDDIELAALAKLPRDQWPEMRKLMERFFIVRDGEWVHKRVQADINELTQESENAAKNGRKGAQKRWAKANDKKRIENGGANHVDGPPIATPSETYSPPMDDSGVRQEIDSHTDTDTDTDTESKPPPPHLASDTYEPTEGGAVFSDFDQLLAIYPKDRIGSVDNAQRQWDYLSLAERNRVLVDTKRRVGIEAHEMFFEPWVKQGGKFAPKLENYLNDSSESYWRSNLPIELTHLNDLRGPTGKPLMSREKDLLMGIDTQSPEFEQKIAEAMAARQENTQ